MWYIVVAILDENFFFCSGSSNGPTETQKTKDLQLGLLGQDFRENSALGMVAADGGLIVEFVGRERPGIMAGLVGSLLQRSLEKIRGEGSSPFLLPGARPIAEGREEIGQWDSATATVLCATSYM